MQKATRQHPLGCRTAQWVNEARRIHFSEDDFNFDASPQEDSAQQSSISFQSMSLSWPTTRTGSSHQASGANNADYAKYTGALENYAEPLNRHVRNWTINYERIVKSGALIRRSWQRRLKISRRRREKGMRRSRLSKRQLQFCKQRTRTGRDRGEAKAFDCAVKKGLQKTVVKRIKHRPNSCYGKSMPRKTRL